jgi:hypothetical protein
MNMKKYACLNRSIPVFIISSLLIACFSASAFAFKLPDTGETRCFRGVDPYDEISCAGTGQDGEYIINPMSFTDNGNGTVTDNNTGLMWQTMPSAYVCNSGSEYSCNWYEAAGVYDATYNPASQNACGSLSFGGHSDWRLPSKIELISIGPHLNTTYFPYQYHSWSSTSSANDPDSAFRVNFDMQYHVYVASSNKASLDSILCVRGEQYPSQDLVDNGNGTVTDNTTGLMWQQGEPGSMAWQAALNYCENLELPLGSGQHDWRLPNIKELESITDDTKYNPAIDTAFFPNAYAFHYWSSTNRYPYALPVSFGVGYVADCMKDTTMYVRCVRGGQSEPQACTYTYSDWGACQPDGTQTRTVSTATPDGCTETPVLSQSCTPLGNLTISPLSVDFGTIKRGTQSAPQEVTLSNTGSGDINVSNISVSDTKNYLLLYGGSAPCIGYPTLTPGSSCTFIVEFNPTTKGNIFATLTVASNDPDTPSLDISLKGTTLTTGWGWVLTVDGITPAPEFIPWWPDASSMYLYDKISTDWRKTIIENIGSIDSSFTWSGDTADTEEAVAKLYEKLKWLNSTNRPVVILAHSWGTVLSFITLAKHSDIKVDKLITLGSPLNSRTLKIDDPLRVAIRAYTLEKLDNFDIYSVTKPSNLNTWHNYYSTCDPVAGKIPVADSNYYNKKQYLLPAGSDNSCHSSYFSNQKNWKQILNDVIKK